MHARTDAVGPTHSLERGHPHVLGASLQSTGVNFALAAPNASAVSLCLFDTSGQREIARVGMPAQTQGVWHGFLPGAGAGQVYGWRVHGPWAPARGHRFNAAKLLLDPCAREVLGHYNGEDIHLGHDPEHPLQPDARDNAAVAQKARVVAEFAGGPAQRVRVNPARRVLYELHVKGFTAAHPAVPPALRGSYAGLAHPASIAHLLRLGVTTVSLMPVAQRADEARLQRAGLSNYWGYSPIAWSAPENRYWSGQENTTARSEFRELVATLHAAGLEVVLDVVYNHTGETDEWGPTLSLRGIDNATYYHLEAGNPARYANWTGCGNCVNMNHPLVLRTVMDSLRLWAQDYGIDGFRFDLASVLARRGDDPGHAFDPHAALFLAIAQDPVLRELLMIAEPWDIHAGGYQLGRFPPGWLEWNDRYRDGQRAFWLKGQSHRGEFAQQIAGSDRVFDPGMRPAHSSVNFITAHDGFTLADLVSYSSKHNHANGEDNRDGHGENLSVNNGVEGPSADPTVQAWRARQRRALLASLVFSLGTPMLLAGDEIGHSQGGNNNAYCQDNTTTWLDWENADDAMCDYVAHLLALRREISALQSAAWWMPGDSGPGPQAQWFNPDARAPGPLQWGDTAQRALTLMLRNARADAARPDGVACLLLVNAAPDPVQFVLPAGPWTLRLDSSQSRTTVRPLQAQEILPPCCLWLACEDPALHSTAMED
jgi:glycogen operon protein